MTNSVPTGSQDLRESALPPEDTHNSVGNVQCVNKRSGMKLSIHTNRTAFKTQDLLVPWHLKDEKIQRGEYSGDDLENKKKDDKASSGYGLCSVNGSDSTPGSDCKMCVGSRVGTSSESGTSPGREPECIVPVYHRYYHLFQQGELEQLCAQIPGVRVQSSYHDQGNWCLILEKIAWHLVNFIQQLYNEICDVMCPWMLCSCIISSIFFLIWILLRINSGEILP